jgi:dTMP kinase
MGTAPFIALEGPEGAGKSTQVGLLEAWLRGGGHDPLVTREPGGTGVGEDVRRVLLESEALPASTELLLMLAARSALVEEVIRPALAAGRVVVTDRFHLSTLAYQGYGRDLPLADVEAMNRFATGGLEPDLTIVLDVDADAGAARLAAAGRGPDRIERAGAAFHRRVVEAYRLLATEGSRAVRVERVDGGASPEVVHDGIVKLLARRFPETFPGPPG